MSQLLLSTLGVVCPTCDEYNPPKATRCSACGGQVYVDAKPAARAAPAAPPGQAPGASGLKVPPAMASAAVPAQATGASGVKVSPLRPGAAPGAVRPSAAPPG